MGRDRAYLRGDVVSAKKYLYVVRALLAARWCLEEHSPGPMRLGELVDAKLPHSLGPVIVDLLERKLAGGECLMVAHVPELDGWVEREDSELYAMAKAERAPEKLPWEVLDDVFLGILRIECDSTLRPRGHE